MVTSSNYGLRTRRRESLGVDWFVGVGFELRITTERSAAFFRTGMI